MADYNIKLGVEVDTSDIQNQINAAGDKVKPIQIKIDTEAKELTKSINDALKGLSNGAKNALKLDTSALQASLTGVKDDIAEIKSLLSSFGSGANTKGLVTSINQIGTALDKVSVKFDELQADLSALAKKDFSFNFNFKAGNANPVKAMTDYGKEARRNAIPALQEQAAALQNLLGGYDKADRALGNYLTKLYKANGANVKSALVGDMADTESASKQMLAIEKYIGYLKKIASEKGIDLSGFDAQFSKSANEIIDDTHKIQTGAKQTEEQLKQMGDELRKVFGNGIDAEKLSSQLDSVVTDLGEIKVSLQGLSSTESLSGLTQSFNKLSETLDKVIANANNFKNAMTGASSGISGASGVAQDVEQVGTSAEKSENKVNELKNALKSIGVNSDTASISREIENLGIKVQKVTRVLNDDGSFSVKVTGVKELNDGLEQTVTLVQRFNSQGIAEGSTQTFTDNIKKANDELLKLKTTADGLSSSASIAKVNNQYTSVQSSFSKLTTVATKTKTSFDGLTTIYKELTSAQESYNNIMQQSDSSDEQKIDAMNRLVEANKKYQNALETTNNLITQQARTERESNNAERLEQQKKQLSSQMSEWLIDNTAATKQFGDRIRILQSQIDSCDDTKLDGLKREFKSITQEAKLAGKTGKTFIDGIKAQFSKYSQYFSVASLYMYAEQGLRDMFEQVKLIDSAMTELKKVTDETDATYNRFLSTAASRAKELGTTIDGLVSSTADFARLGYNFKDAQGLAEVANIYAVVGDDVEGVEGATESLISTMAAFKDSAKDMSNTDFAMSIVDKMNAVGNNFAISSGGIGEALERSASSLMSANSTLDESISLIAAANEVVQNPEKVGNAMKTISMRIRGAKTELEEMGEDTTGMVESTSKLRQEIMALSGVDLMLDENTFKAPFAIFDELSAKWKNLTDIQRASITELLAGKHQGNVFASLMENFDTAREALNTSLESAGSALEEHSKWSESLEAKNCLVV